MIAAPATYTTPNNYQNQTAQYGQAQENRKIDPDNATARKDMLDKLRSRRGDTRQDGVASSGSCQSWQNTN